jgi:hypothetical protein
MYRLMHPVSASEPANYLMHMKLGAVLLSISFCAVRCFAIDADLAALLHALLGEQTDICRSADGQRGLSPSQTCYVGGLHAKQDTREAGWSVRGAE